MNDTQWRNILTDPTYSRTVHISVRDHRGNYTERYIVSINEEQQRSRGHFAEFAPLVEQYGLTIAVCVKFIDRQRIDLIQGTGHNGLDIECFGREVRQILFLPTEDSLYESGFSPPDKLVIAGYTISCHYKKERIGEIARQSAEIYADGRIRFSDPVPVTL